MRPSSWFLKLMPLLLNLTCLTDTRAFIKLKNSNFIIFFARTELFKTQIKKETLETEIELLENQIKLKRRELSCGRAVGSKSHDDYDANTASHHSQHNFTSASSNFVDQNHASGKQAMNGFKSCSFVTELPPQPVKAPFSYDEV
jgi:hypothetical protein